MPHWPFSQLETAPFFSLTVLGENVCKISYFFLKCFEEFPGADFWAQIFGEDF